MLLRRCAAMCLAARGAAAGYGSSNVLVSGSAQLTQPRGTGAGCAHARSTRKHLYNLPFSRRPVLPICITCIMPALLSPCRACVCERGAINCLDSRVSALPVAMVCGWLQFMTRASLWSGCRAGPHLPELCLSSDFFALFSAKSRAILHPPCAAAAVRRRLQTARAASVAAAASTLAALATSPVLLLAATCTSIAANGSAFYTFALTFETFQGVLCPGLPTLKGSARGNLDPVARQQRAPLVPPKAALSYR